MKPEDQHDKRELTRVGRNYARQIIFAAKQKPSIPELVDGFLEAHEATVDVWTKRLVRDGLTQLFRDILQSMTISEESDQLVLPYGLEELDGVISFRRKEKRKKMKNSVVVEIEQIVDRWTALAYATGEELLSHMKILAEQASSVNQKHSDYKRLWKLIGKVLKTNPKMTVMEACERLNRDAA
jgi:hypothetical protein